MKLPRAHPRCGTGIWPERDLAARRRHIAAPRPSLPTALLAPPRTPAGKARLFDVRERNPARYRLSAGGNRIRTIGPAVAKGLSAVAEGRRRTDKLDGVVKHQVVSRDDDGQLRASLDGCLFLGGLMVRIRFPPAKSLLRTRFPDSGEYSGRRRPLPRTGRDASGGKRTCRRLLFDPQPNTDRYALPNHTSCNERRLPRARAGRLTIDNLFVGLRPEALNSVIQHDGRPFALAMPR
jgi:hypothetical protein